ncbi:DNA polymerase III subunit gamma/tau [Desulfovibrio sp. OttesenSCG-928-G11]|nr:DNA polymerase III subunit gamma/tau [Desulfovibrio sp. OttesenSCG-928-G11]
MQQPALTARYRPQTFAQVAGQDTLKSILSRASLEDRVAPAYLFSGTRGVGKTTMARIFAKALNCRKAPTDEPCNVCDQCRAVIAGSAVDVVEIDGASNRGIDDVRRLREVVGYAPMEGRYKIFIIDEAHMLSREAFNALLKTLEEPPPRVTFIMATTEAHKFPATIISRCQQYVFKRLPEKALAEHLAAVLGKEGLAFEPAALRLIARRGAGSVRDAMSLLSQVIALGEDSLSEEASRRVLGLAGQEVYLRFLELVKKGDCPGLSLMLRELLDQGLDMGFFLRELSSLWRNLFMLRQGGGEALPLVDLPENEARRLQELGRDLSLQHIHACWQMTLEGQRRVLSSLEPALALELLLLNLAMLPRLLSLESLSAASRQKAPPQDGGQGQGEGRPDDQGPARSGERPTDLTDARSEKLAIKPEPEADEAAIQSALLEIYAAAPPENGGPPEPEAPVVSEAAIAAEAAPLPDSALSAPAAKAAPTADAEFSASAAAQSGSAEPLSVPQAVSTAIPPAVSTAIPPAVSTAIPPAASPAAPVWEDLLELCSTRSLPPGFAALLRAFDAGYRDGVLELTPPDAFSAAMLAENGNMALLRELLAACGGAVPELRFGAPLRRHRSREEIKEEVLRHPLVLEMKERFGATCVDCGEQRPHA